MTEHSWFGPASQASQQCSQDLHAGPLLPPARAFAEPAAVPHADGPHNCRVEPDPHGALRSPVAGPPVLPESLTRAVERRHGRRESPATVPSPW